MVKAVYPGSFDPVTYGHMDLMRRGAQIFSELVVGVGNNPRKTCLFSMDERVAFIKEATRDLPNVTVTPFDSLLVEFSRQVGAKIILKGLRAITDFDYELQMSLINRRLAPDVETVFMMASEEYSFASSTVLKEIASLKGDVSLMVPPYVEKALVDKLSALD